MTVDGATLSGDRGRRWRLYPLLPTLISKLIQKELYKSMSASILKSEICLLTILRLFRSGILTALLETHSHQNSWTARTPPPLAHQLVCLWLRAESSEYFSRVEIFGPSEHSLSPVKPSAALFKTLGWMEYPLNGNGLGPRAQQHLGPLCPRLKVYPNSCGPTPNTLKYEMIIIAHQPFKPRCVYFHQRTSLISLMFQNPVLVGRRLHPSRVDTSYGLVGLMVSFEGLNFLKNLDSAQSLICFSPSRTVFEWYRQFSNWYTKLYPEETTHRISLTAGSNPGPLLASCPVVMSRTHGNSFFLVAISFVENFSRFGLSNMLPSLFIMMLCFHGSIYRRLISYLETTSMNWFCEYFLQILRVNSSITDYDETMFFLTYCLMPVRLGYMEFSATSQCQLIRTIHHLLELIANVAATHLDLASDLMLCLRLRVLWDMRSQFLCAMLLYHYVITFVVASLVLAKTLSFVISSSAE